MTTEERDQLLLEIRAGQQRLETRLGSMEVYMKAMAGKLLSPVEIKQVEMQTMWAAQEAATVAQPPP